jgi:hypothetical protein
MNEEKPPQEWKPLLCKYVPSSHASKMSVWEEGRIKIKRERYRCTSENFSSCWWSKFYQFLADVSIYRRENIQLQKREEAITKKPYSFKKISSNMQKVNEVNEKKNSFQ